MERCGCPPPPPRGLLHGQKKVKEALLIIFQGQWASEEYWQYSLKGGWAYFVATTTLSACILSIFEVFRPV